MADLKSNSDTKAAYEDFLSEIKANYGKGITEFEFGDRRLELIPPEIGQLTELESLKINCCKISTLPKEIGLLKKLKKLELISNQISSFPAEFFELESLETLEVGDNCLHYIPENIAKLKNLRFLNLSDNKFESFPENILEVTSLRSIRLDTNHIASIPQRIENLIDLEKIYISNVELEFLPLGLFKLKNLQVLWCYNNNLKSIPAEIGELINLKQISFSNNNISELPAELGKLSLLESLILEDNFLRELPDSFKRLEKLKLLTLHGNRSLGMPAELLGPRLTESDAKQGSFPNEILDFYFSIKGSKGQSLKEIKVLVVGRGGVGKTSVIRRLKGLPLDRSQSETHGIAIETLDLPCEIGSVTARVWDFGGQHVLHAMHEFFFTGRSLYILVLGEREDMAERDAEYWLQLIRSYAGEAPVIVVMNKSGSRARELDIPRRKLEESYGPIVSWMTTECMEDNSERGGINALKEAIVRAVGEMDEIYARFPKKWLQIKESLSNMKESYLNYSDYAARCKQLGESSTRKQEELASFLHDLGVALNYRRDPRLHETTVLRPDWLADGIYALLRANDTRHIQPFAIDGIITLERMPSIYAAAENLKMLKASEYPLEKHSFLLRLMGAFQLSFPLNEQGTEQLVPSLLSVEEPENKVDISGFTNNFRWEFSIVPSPLLPRLLIKTFGLILDKMLWRRGAIYMYGPAMAKIWEDKERYIYLSVGLVDLNSDADALKDLIRMIRGSLNELFKEYQNLTVQEQIKWGGNWLPRESAVALKLISPDEQNSPSVLEGLA